MIPKMEVNQSRTPEDTARNLVKSVSTLVSPPDVCVRVFDLLKANRASADQFAEVIMQDPNLASQLLKLVNSAFYGFPSRIDTVSRAMALIGTQELYNLVIAVSAVRTFSGISSHLVDMNSFWKHSVVCGLTARTIAKRCNVLHPERMFVAGLLHDIGSLVLYRQMPEASRELLSTAGDSEQLLHEFELTMLGFGHAMVGQCLLELWGLPEELTKAVGFHHASGTDSPGTLESKIVLVADAFTNAFECLGLDAIEELADIGIYPSDWQSIGISSDDLEYENIMAEVSTQIGETTSLLSARA